MFLWWKADPYFIHYIGVTLTDEKNEACAVYGIYVAENGLDTKTSVS